MNLSEEQQRVLELTDQYSVFITGRAGTGKTFLLKQIIDFHQRKHGLNGVGVSSLPMLNQQLAQKVIVPDWTY